MLKMMFANTRVEIYIKNQSDSRYGLLIKDYKLARKINKALNHYPADTRFVPGDEVIFTFLPAQIKTVANTDPKLGKILAQTFGPLR